MIDDEDKLRDGSKTGREPDPVERGDVLTNAFRRLDNRYRGVPNDESLIGEDLPEEEEADGDAEDDPDADDEDRDQDVRNRLW